MQKEKLAILDAGSQLGKVIATRTQSLSVQTDILPIDTPVALLTEYRAFIISGGPQSLKKKHPPTFDLKLLTLGKPILGICYGMQLLNFVHLGSLTSLSNAEYGQTEIKIDTSSALFFGLDQMQKVLMSHSDNISILANEFRSIAMSRDQIVAMENTKQSIYGVLFHPEVDLTLQGNTILENFLFRIAEFSGTSQVKDKKAEIIESLEETVKNKKVILFASGGVDSTVCAALLRKALSPKQIYAIYIDNGFMRKFETNLIKEIYRHLGITLHIIDVRNNFMSASTVFNGKQTLSLSKTIYAEEKRAIIGDEYIKTFESIITKLGLDENTYYLVQGTLRSDLIEGAGQNPHASKIKTHHNDSDLVRNLRAQGKVIEPLQFLFKDEVRNLARQLGLPASIVWKQAFPGTGLAIRVICAKKHVGGSPFNHINEQLKKYCTSDFSVTLLPIKTTGVQGDRRTLSYIVGISGRKDWQKIFQLAKEIPEKIPGVNRVVYIFGNQVKGSLQTITPTYISKETIQQARDADFIVQTIFEKYGLLKKLQLISVLSVILFPVNFGKDGYRSIAIRTFRTKDHLTGVPAMPGIDFPDQILDEVTEELISHIPNIARVVYDVTGKPPATDQWE